MTDLNTAIAQALQNQQQALDAAAQTEAEDRQKAETLCKDWATC